MSMSTSRRLPVTVLVVAAVLLAGSLLAVPWLARSATGSGAAPVAVNGPGWSGGGPGWAGGGMMGGPGAGMMGGSGPGMMGGWGPGMMSGRVWLSGNGVAVTSIAAARSRAAQAATPQGLHPGEVIQFSNAFYVELKDASGASVTEVLLDPAGGAVTTEPGPAMMWNTGSRTARISPEQARSIATEWLAAHHPSESVQSIDAYPGYYTLDTQVAGTVRGMMSVNATTGAVWYHTWHGTFVAREDS